MKTEDTSRSSKTLRDLFTRDVMNEGLYDLMRYQTLEAWRYFGREFEEPDVRTKPWYLRWWLRVWRTFLSIAFRLSPARRALFVISALLLILSWLRFGLEAIFSWFLSPPSWGLLAATILFLLLTLELRDKLVLMGDLETARQIQFGLLPAPPYDRDGVKAAAALHSARIVGGDYFDLIDLSAGDLGVVVADVAGKGMPAALLMALLHGSLRTLLAAGLRGAPLLNTLNTHLHASMPSNQLVTMFYAELETSTGRLRYINAGHNAPFVIRGNGCDRLPSTGLPLGILPNASYEESQTLMAPRDQLFVFTDGLSEALDKAEREYGESRLEGLLVRCRDLAAADIVQHVEADVALHCTNVQQHDDLTMLIVARNPQPAN